MTGTAYTFDAAAFSRAVREARGNRSLRAMEESIRERFGESPSVATLNRIEGGHEPDFRTFSVLCSFMGVNPGKFFTGASAWEEAQTRFTAVEKRVADLESWRRWNER